MNALKSNLALWLLVFGGIVAANTYSLPIPPAITIIIGGFFASSSFYCFTAVFGGIIWGIKINRSTSGTLIKILSTIGMFIGGYGVVITFIAVLSSLSRFNLIGIVLYLIAFIVPLVIGPMICKVLLEKSTAKEQNAMILAQLPLFAEIDQNIAEASRFVVGFEGVALFTNTGYCYAVYRYEDYQLGELSTPQEVALVGTYFVQRYHDRYTYKVDTEIIPGEPGRTAVAFGTGGIAVARVSGTRDQRLFRSYIFMRK